MKNIVDLKATCVTAGTLVLLAVIFITGCDSQPPTASTPAAGAPSPSATPTSPPADTATPAPATATVTPAASATSAATDTATPTTTPSPTVSPTATPSATPSPTATLPPPSPEPPGVTVSETTLTLPTYPIQDYLIEQTDPAYNMPVFYFNRPAFEADAPTPTPVDYTGVVLENPYLRLTFLPELGGRLYSAVIKSTGQEVFYHNPVVKPSRYGVLQPYEANWWLATGGMEFAYPVQEHGYRFGVPWEVSVSQTESAAAITLSDSAPDRPGLAVTVSLPADSPVFTVAPTLTNNFTATVPVQLWTNAALALTSRSMSADTRFVIPTQAITIHSRGADGWTVPEAGQTAPWPQVGTTDLRDYRQWANYLGFFVSNENAPFLGAANPALKLGIVRLVDSATPGAGKLFAFSRSFTDRSYTNDDSQYFEIWGGLNQSFWPADDIDVPPGGSVGWQEQWWPLAGLPGLTWANPQVAMHLAPAGDESYQLSALLARPQTGSVQVWANNALLIDNPFETTPAQPLTWTFSAASPPTRVEFLDKAGQSLLTYQHD